MNKTYTFVDLFAGIGGFNLGLSRAGFKCVASVENNEHACKMYKLNYDIDPFGDVTKIDSSKFPDFDILTAGFPCQAFSICGKQKGFYDETRGTLIFDVLKLIEEKKPKVVFLENVKNLVTHDKGRTFKVIINSLENLGYTVNYKILNAKDFNTPQNRERIIIIGSKDGIVFDFDKIKTKSISSMEKFLDKDGDFEFLDARDYTLLNKDFVKRQAKSGLVFAGYRNKKIREKGVRPGTIHLSRVHKQTNRIYSCNGIHPTIASQEKSGRYWILLNNNKVRKLTINECYRFFGYPDEFKKEGLDSQLYERIGNSVCVNMIEAVANEISNQLFGGNNMDNSNPAQFLENIYRKANNIENCQFDNINKSIKQWCDTLVKYEETSKGVYTVTITSLTYKSLHPEQDIRKHKIELENGYSGRSFDTKYVTPFLKTKQFLGAMKESGWLTRSLEQPHEFDFDFPGKINNKEVKNAFLNILNYVETKKINPAEILTYIFSKSIIEKNKKLVILVNPIDKESKCTIDEIMYYLDRHFHYKYKSRGASILPVIALYSVYQILIKEMNRYDNKTLDKLASHNSSDRSSGATGDIVVRDIDKNLYEVVEVKFDIPVSYMMIEDVYKKIGTTGIQRYYILSTKGIVEKEKDFIYSKIESIENEHGCQIIVNGIMNTLKYYLRLLDNTDEFLVNYLKNITDNSELNHEHKIAWNKILKEEKVFVE